VSGDPLGLLSGEVGCPWIMPELERRRKKPREVSQRKEK
jgi:hypothetical protein